MATETLNKPSGTEDDEEWLYGGTSNAENKQPESLGAMPAGGAVPTTEGADVPPKFLYLSHVTRKPVFEIFDQPGEEPSQEDDDDDSDDDNVQVTIGDIQAFPVSDAGSRMFKGGAPYQKGAQGQKGGTAAPGVKGVDPDAEGIVNGVSVYEFNLDTLKDEEKPWRKPGADITDYFNYGFNEESWKQYCSKQNKLRAENGLSAPKFPLQPYHHHQPVFVRVPSTLTPNPASQPQNIQPIGQPGTIAVLGSTTASRRPADEDIQTIGTIGTEIDVKPDIGLPPPPGMPMEVPPPDYSVPPPGMPHVPHVFPNIPPPGMNVPPPMFNAGPPPGFFPPPQMHPPDPRFADRPPPFGYEPPHSQPPPFADPSAAWDSRERDSYRDKYDYKKRDKSPGSGYSSGGSDDYRYSRSSDRRDYYDRDREYSRSRDSRRDRSRSRSRSRSRERRHREKDDKYKSSKTSRKIKQEPDDSDYYKSSSTSSKHKKSKKSKRDKSDDDYSPSRPSRDEDTAAAN